MYTTPHATFFTLPRLPLPATHLVQLFSLVPSTHSVFASGLPPVLPLCTFPILPLLHTASHTYFYLAGRVGSRCLDVFPVLVLILFRSSVTPSALRLCTFPGHSVGFPARILQRVPLNRALHTTPHRASSSLPLSAPLDYPMLPRDRCSPRTPCAFCLHYVHPGWVHCSFLPPTNTPLPPRCAHRAVTSTHTLYPPYFVPTTPLHSCPCLTLHLTHTFRTHTFHLPTPHPPHPPPTPPPPPPPTHTCLLPRHTLPRHTQQTTNRLLPGLLRAYRRCPQFTCPGRFGVAAARHWRHHCACRQRFATHAATRTRFTFTARYAKPPPRHHDTLDTRSCARAFRPLSALHNARWRAARLQRVTFAFFRTYRVSPALSRHVTFSYQLHAHTTFVRVYYARAYCCTRRSAALLLLLQIPRTFAPAALLLRCPMPRIFMRRMQHRTCNGVPLPVRRHPDQCRSVAQHFTRFTSYPHCLCTHTHPLHTPTTRHAHTSPTPHTCTPRTPKKRRRRGHPRTTASPPFHHWTISKHTFYWNTRGCASTRAGTRGPGRQAWAGLVRGACFARSGRQAALSRSTSYRLLVASTARFSSGSTLLPPPPPPPHTHTTPHTFPPHPHTFATHSHHTFHASPRATTAQPHHTCTSTPTLPPPPLLHTAHTTPTTHPHTFPTTPYTPPVQRGRVHSLPALLCLWFSGDRFAAYGLFCRFRVDS